MQSFRKDLFLFVRCFVSMQKSVMKKMDMWNLTLPLQKIFQTDFLELSFTGVAVEGSCPAEKDNDGCFFLGETEILKPAEHISEKKEFCDCSFQWKFTDGDAHGVSIGKTLPAYPTETEHIYPKEAFTAENAAKIPCNQVLGTYVVKFER